MRAAVCLRGLALLVIFLALEHRAGAQQPGHTPPPEGKPAESGEPALKSVVLLSGANAGNDALTRIVQPGPLTLNLQLRVAAGLTSGEGRLSVTGLQATTTPVTVIDPHISLDDGESSASFVRITMASPAEYQVTLDDARLRPATTYKGALSLSAGNQNHVWDITLTTGALGVIAADPIPALQFAVFPFQSDAGSFEFILRDKFGTGPFHNVRASFDPGNAGVSTDIRSNFDIGRFSFWALQGGPKATEAEVNLKGDGSGTTVERQRTVKARVAALYPGAYSGALRFAADEAAEDATESRMPITLQVRHHWLLPLLVLVIGSAVGWYSAKYVAGERKARQLARRVRQLRARADHLARREGTRRGWEFPSESTSFGLAKVRVELSRLGTLTSSAIPVLVREEEIAQDLQAAELRVSKLELLRATRLKVQAVADGRPGAQLALGRLLRRATDILESPALGETTVTDFTATLHAAEAWLVDQTALVQYRAALVARRDSDEVPSADAVAGLTRNAVAQRLQALLQTCPSDAALNGAADLAALQVLDQQLAALILLWRERERPWADGLAQASTQGRPLTDQFDLVDAELWEQLAKEAFTIERDTTSQNRVRAYELVELTLDSTVAGLTARMIYHPLHVVWSIELPGGQIRTVETNGMKLVQYFNSPGKVTVNAVLRWRAADIAVRAPITFDVTQNGEFVNRRALSLGAVEWSVLGIATAFAVATAMSTQYGPTFGSFKEYLALFIWAAGAGGGGNLFKQLGTTSTPGGQADAALPARTP